MHSGCGLIQSPAPAFSPLPLRTVMYLGAQEADEAQWEGRRVDVSAGQSLMAETPLPQPSGILLVAHVQCVTRFC